MPATFIQRGDMIDYTPATDLPAGSVVAIEDLVGITTRPIAAGQPGVLVTEGIFSFPKQTGAGKAIPFGKTVYWHTSSEDVRSTVTGGKLLGKAVQETGDDDATIRVRLGSAG